MSAERADRLAELMADEGLESILVTHLLNVRYLSGFTGTNGACVITPEERIFLTDFRYVEQAQEQVSGFTPVKGERDLLADLAGRARGRTGFDDAHMSVRTHAAVAEKAGEGVELVPAGGLVERLRRVKEPAELAAVRAAAALADDALGAVLEGGLAGRTEREFARALEQEMRERGAEEPSFPAIVAAGAHGALPHAVPREAEIPPGALVVIDWGAKLDGYCSDCTRTFASGQLEPEEVETYELVRGAQQAARDAVRAGAGLTEVDAVARGLIEAAGHGERFGHPLGHGVGLDVHEEPRVGPRSEGELQAGEVVTVEPGVYLPGRFGIRVEDLVAVTAGGCEVFSGLSRELTVVG
jgi:Xaa-Pro aminopeptidase